MRTRRHHNNDNRVGIKNGATRKFVKRLAKKLNLPKPRWVEIIDPQEIAAITGVHYRDWHPTWQRKEGGRIYARVDEVFKAWRAARSANNTRGVE